MTPEHTEKALGVLAFALVISSAIGCAIIAKHHFGKVGENIDRGRV
jgi:hypothetical protein